MGAVMGSKKVKGIAFWGDHKKQVADADGLKAFAAEFLKENRDAPASNAFKTKGTPMMVDLLDKAGPFPRSTGARGGWRIERRSTPPPARTLRRDPPSLPQVLHGLRQAEHREGRAPQGAQNRRPEYETIYTFGGLCMVDSIEEIAYINDICDRLGLDTMSAGNLVAFTIEAGKRGKVETDLDYGDVDGIVGLVEDIAYRRGLGAVLAEGIKYAAQEWGAEDLAVHVKGMEPSGYDPRVLKGMSLAYGTSDRGACHLRSTFYKFELGGLFDPEQIAGKAAAFADWEDRHVLMDTMIFCRFYRDFYPWEVFHKAVKLLTGEDMSEEALRAVSWAVHDDTRRFNLREGLTPEDDRLPSRLLKEVLPEPARGSARARCCRCSKSTTRPATGMRKGTRRPPTIRSNRASAVAEASLWQDPTLDRPRVRGGNNCRSRSSRSASAVAVMGGCKRARAAGQPSARTTSASATLTPWPSGRTISGLMSS